MPPFYNDESYISALSSSALPYLNEDDYDKLVFLFMESLKGIF